MKKENHLYRILRPAGDLLREETGGSGDKPEINEAKEILARAYIYRASRVWSIILNSG
jgi:hypothetical protein